MKPNIYDTYMMKDGKMFFCCESARFSRSLQKKVLSFTWINAPLPDSAINFPIVMLPEEEVRQKIDYKVLDIGHKRYLIAEFHNGCFGVVCKDGYFIKATGMSWNQVNKWLSSTL